MNQQKGENDRRKYGMINLHERMLSTRRESNPQPSDLQSGAHPTKPPRSVKGLDLHCLQRYLVRSTRMKELISLGKTFSAWVSLSFVLSGSTFPFPFLYSLFSNIYRKKYGPCLCKLNIKIIFGNFLFVSIVLFFFSDF